MSNAASTYGFVFRSGTTAPGHDSKISSRTNLTPNSRGAQDPEGGTDQMVSAQRRHRAQQRRAFARESGLLKETVDKPFTFASDDMKVVAQAMFDQYKVGRITRGQIEAEQRADKDRLTGWKVQPPQPGTQGEEKVKRLEYRIAIRGTVLDQILKYELPYLVGTTGRSAEDQETSTRPPDKPWRPGAEMK